MTRVSQWTWTDWGREQSQINAINDLDLELAQQRHAQARRSQEIKDEFKSGLKQVDRKLASVDDRLDTVLEWTELRFQLLEFDEYAVRKELRKPFRALAAGVPAAVPDIDDVAGYWLPPAAMAILRLVVRDDALKRGKSVDHRPASNSFTDLKASLESARDRDAVRSELFNLAVGLCFDQPAFIDAAVLRLLSEPVGLGLTETGEVAAGWRTVWEHAARGEFGPGAADQLTDRLRQEFDPEALSEPELIAWDEAIATFGARDGNTLPAAEAFDLLREHLGAAEDMSAVAETADPDERWRVYLQELIEEPSPAELPLVEAMEELHMPDDQIRRSEPTWGESDGSVSALLRRDLFDTDGSPVMRGLALELAAPLLRSRVERLADAPDVGEPITLTVKRLGAAVKVDRNGPDAEQLAAAERRLSGNVVLDAPSTPVTVAIAGGFGAITLLSLVTANWFLAVLFAVGIAVPVWHYRKSRRLHAESETRRDEHVAALRAGIDKAVEQIRRDERERHERAAGDASARDELLEALK